MTLSSNLYNLQFKYRQRLAAALYRRKEPAASSVSPKRILFILTGLIGDSVMSYPAISEARRAWPDAFIAVVGKSHNRDLLAGCSDFDEFYVCDTDPFSFRGRSAVKELQRWITAGNFDTSIILLGDQYAHLLAKAGIPVRVGVKGTLMEKCLTHVYDIGSPRTWGVNERLNALRVLGWSVDSVVPKFSLDFSTQKDTTDKLLACGLPDGQRFAVMHPFGSTTAQWWNVSNAVAVADHLFKKYSLKLVVVGKKYSLNGMSVFPELVSKSPNIIDTIDKLNLRELIDVIALAEIVITTDSGPFHIAGALQKPTVGLFRTRRPEHAHAYQNSVVTFGHNDLCQTTCEWNACESMPCRQMENISVDDVLGCITRLLNEGFSNNPGL